MDASILWAAIKWSNQRADGSVCIPADRVAGIEKAIREHQGSHLSAEEEIKVARYGGQDDN